MAKASVQVVRGGVTALLVSVAFLMAGGCASQPTEMAPQATEALTTMRTQLFTGKSQVQEAANAARDLLDQPRADLTAQIQRLNTAVASLNATRERTRTQAAAQEERSGEFFAKWDESLKTMSEETAERGQKRLAMAKESVARLRQDASDIRQHLNPFMAEVNEAAKYLTTDTTKSGLDVVRPKLQAAIKREPNIMRAIDKAIADIDSIRGGK